MAVMNGADFAAKWASRLSSATNEISRGVDAVTVAPSVSAVAKKAKLVAKWNEAINNGKWEKNLSKVTLEDWKTAMKNKGINRIGQGATEAASKMAAFGEKLLAYQNAGLPAISRMPDNTVADGIARASAWITYMSKMPK